MGYRDSWTLREHDEQVEYAESDVRKTEAEIRVKEAEIELEEAKLGVLKSELISDRNYLAKSIADRQQFLNDQEANKENG